MLTVFQENQEADRNLTNQTFADLQSQAKSLLDGLDGSYTDNLLLLDRQLSALNARRRLANRTPTDRILAQLSLSDFNDIDQSQTTATVRIDTGVATLRERLLPSRANTSSIIFTADKGYASNFGNVYQVYVDSRGQVPTGTFAIQLASTVNASAISFDIVSTPSVPGLSVSVSADGSTYIPADTVNILGYRITASFAGTSVKYIKLIVSPTHADNIDGMTYSFGITDISLAAVQYQMSSQIASRPILINPSGASFLFNADADTGVLFYLSLNGAPYFQVASGQEIPVPSATETKTTPVAIDGSNPGLLSISYPGAAYPTSLKVTDLASGKSLPVLPGLDPSASGVSNLRQKYIAAYNNTLTLVPVSTDDNAKTFTVSYTSGPASITVEVRALITTSDRSRSLQLRGITFEEI